MAVTFNIYHDKRSPNAKNIYTVKVRLYFDGIEKMYPVYHKGNKLRLSPEDFASSYESNKPKNEHREYKVSITECYNRADNIIDNLDPFTFKDFEKRYTGKIKGNHDVITLYNKIIEDKEAGEELGTADNYRQSLSSIKGYYKYLHGVEAKEIPFKAITAQFLKDYEKYMTTVEAKDGDKIVKKICSPTTVGFYLRPLRAVFRSAIDEERIIQPELYPFGKGRNLYIIPTGKKVKKALTKEQLSAFYNLDLSANEKAFKARAFWFLSYLGNGMNIKDMALLKYKDIDTTYFTFIRAKTAGTTKSNPVTVKVPINEYVKGMFKEYGNPDTSPENYVFDIVNRSMTAKERQVSIKNFTRFVNQALKPVAEAIGLPKGFSTYHARHSYVTIAIQNGATTETIKDALGHLNIKTTQGYVGSLEEGTLTGIQSQLLKQLTGGG